MIAPHATTDRDDQETRNITQLEACSLCLGDMVEERAPGDAELVCIQCGQLSAAPAARSPISAAPG